MINLNIKETEGSCSNRSENSSEIKLDISRTPATDSSLSSHHHHQQQQQPIPNLFPSSNIDRSNTNNIVAHQLFHNSSSRPSADHQGHRISIDQSTAIKEECFSNMFVGIEDQSGFWPWLEQPQFNWWIDEQPRYSNSPSRCWFDHIKDGDQSICSLCFKILVFGYLN